MLVHVVMSKFVGGCIAGEACLPLVITQLGWWSGVSELCSTCWDGRLCVCRHTYESGGGIAPVRQ